MKRNHLQVEQHLRRALQACGDDFALQEVRLLLNRAIGKVGGVAKKRLRRNLYAERFAEQAKEKHSKWWQQIVDNVKIHAKAQAELESKSKPKPKPPGN